MKFPSVISATLRLDMNLRKVGGTREDMIDRSLRHELKQWAAHQVPPRNGWAQILQTARLEAPYRRRGEEETAMSLHGNPSEHKVPMLFDGRTARMLVFSFSFNAASRLCY